MATQVTHIMVDVDLILAKPIDFGPESVNILGTNGILGSDLSLVSLELSPHMRQQLLEVLGVI